MNQSTHGHAQHTGDWFAVRDKMRRYLILGALTFVVIAAGFSRRIRHADPPVRKPVEDSLALSVLREGPALRLRWDPSTIRNSTYAELLITDGAHQTKLPLNSGLLASGSFSYVPITRDVAFRLEIPGDPVVRGSAKVADEPIAKSVESPPVMTPEPPLPKSQSETSARSRVAAKKRIDTKPSPFPGPEAPVTLPEALPLAPEVPPSLPVYPAPPPPVRSAPPLRPGVSVEVEPAPPSTMGRVVGRVGRLPLIRHLRRPSEPVVPPKPTVQAAPSVSLADRRTLTSPLTIDVRVAVDETGKVESAEAIGETARQTPFAAAAVSAARRWKFAPARSGDMPVPGKLILHFRFLPMDQ